ncbi:MAG: NADH-quinone oxidoreductase subunit J [Caldimicrobium sp.]
MFERGLILLILTFFSFLLFFLTFLFKDLLYQFLTILLLMILLGVYYLFLNAEFLAAIQIIVYAGAILIMFLFTLFLFPDEKVKASKEYIQKGSYLTFFPTGFFLFLILITLFKGIPDFYSIQKIEFDLKSISKILFNEYWILIYILAFLLSLPMIALYIFFGKENTNGDF